MHRLFTDHTAQHAIDLEINQLLAKVQELRILRNNHSAIHKMPIEIISLILLTSKRVDFYSGKHTWNSLLGVCRRWRNILLAMPAFWAMVDIPSQCGSVEQVIQRSKPYPLSVAVFLSQGDNKSFQNILSERDRFKELCLTYSTMASVTAFSSTTTSHSLPLLQALTLKAARNRSCYVSSPLPFITSASLTILRLQDVTFEPDIPVLLSLRRLTVGGDWLATGELSIIWMSKILRKTPNIEEAHIWGISDSFDTFEDQDLLPITLPFLKRLIIASKAVSESDLFDLLRFPKSAIIIALYSGHFDFVSPEFLRFDTLLLRFETGSDAISFKKMRIVLGHDYVNAVNDDDGEASFHLELFDLDTQMAEPSIALGIPFHSDTPGLYLNVCKLASLFAITELVLSQFQPYHEWQELFSAVVNLETLSLEGLGDSWLPQLLASATRAPALKIISYKCMALHGTLISENHDFNRDIPSAQVLDTVMDTMGYPQDEEGFSRLQFIKRRRDTGVPLKKLIVHECNVAQRYIDILKMYVDVEWDGIERVMDIGNKCPGPYSMKYSDRLSDFDEE